MLFLSAHVLSCHFIFIAVFSSYSEWNGLCSLIEEKFKGLELQAAAVSF